MPNPTDPRPNLSTEIKEKLIKLEIPLSLNPCDGCASEEGDELELEYPKGWEVDYESDLLGSYKDYGRQILISSSKSDWFKEVTEEPESLAKFVYEAYTAGDEAGASVHDEVKGPDRSLDGIKGIYPSLTSFQSKSTEVSLDKLNLDSHSTSPPPLRLAITSSSFNSTSHSENHHSVIVLPDYKIIFEVRESKESAEDLVKNYLDEKIPRSGVSNATTRTTLRSWPLPYHAVVLICSHKKRDKRCSQAAPLLIAQFHKHLEQHGLEVDERGDGRELHEGEPIEDWAEPKEKRMEETLKGIKTGGTVGVFKVSHVGGHKFAGNIVIYLPNGSTVWYGRVNPRDIKSIVEETIIGGKIIPELLRGALGVEGKSSGSILSW